MKIEQIPAEMKKAIAKDMAAIREAFELAEASYDAELMARAVRAYGRLCDMCAEFGLPCPAVIC
jgi:hypothetical protein